MAPVESITGPTLIRILAVNSIKGEIAISMHTQIPVPSPDDPILGRWMPPPLPPEIIDGEEECVVEDILDSKFINQKLWYLVKWKDFRMEHNSWEPWENVHAPDIIADFHWKHPGATRHIWSAEFFPSLSNPPSCRDVTILKGGWMSEDTTIRLPLLLSFLPPPTVPDTSLHTNNQTPASC